MILTVTLNAAVDSTWRVDNLVVGSINRVGAEEPTRVAGGKGINVARFIHKLGERVLATGFVGGFMGELIKSQLEDEGIDFHFIPLSGESRECLIILNSADGTWTGIYGTGPKVPPSKLDEFKSFFADILSSCKLVCLSGSLPLGVPRDFYADLISLSRKEDIPIILDTSGEALKEGVQAKPFMIKPNLQEFKEIFNLSRGTNSERSVEEKANALVATGLNVVAISKGEEGSIIYSKNKSWRMIPPKIRMTNPVGAGDAFVGGFAVGIVRGQSIRDSAILGTAGGAAKAEVLRVGDITLSRVQELVKEVECHPLT